MLPLQGATGLIPSCETKIPHAAWCAKKKKKNVKSEFQISNKYFLNINMSQAQVHSFLIEACPMQFGTYLSSNIFYCLSEIQI